MKVELKVSNIAVNYKMIIIASLQCIGDLQKVDFECGKF